MGLPSGQVFPVESIPERIGAYRVLRRLTAPGPAETFLGRAEGPRGFARECVLKRMKNTIEGNERLAEELSREAAICSRINHPAILRMIDFFEDAGHLVLALEYIDGTALDQLLDHLAERRVKLGDAAAFYIGHRVAGALAYAHAATDDQGVPTPIIHRNLHPSNVVIGADGDVRLTGFGVGKILGRTPDTAIGTIKGTPGYMAPEQARGEPVTAKADTYGMGLLLWSLLTGLKPPQDGTWPAKISTLRKDLPREIAAVIDASLDRFPGTRRITCGEIERWLGKVASDEKGRRELKEQMLTLADELSEVDIEGDIEGDIEVEPEVATRPPAAPAAAPANPFQGVRFGPPAPVEVKIQPAAPEGPKARGDWRQSLPDVDNLDDLIDSVRSPDRSRVSEPTLPQSRAYPPAPPLPPSPAPIAAPVMPPAPRPAIAPVAIVPAPPIASAPRVAPAPAARDTPVVVIMAATSPKVAAQPVPAASVILAPSVAIVPAPTATPPPEPAISAPVFGAPPVFSPGPPPVASSSSRASALPDGVPPPRQRPPSPSLLAASRRTLGTGGTIGVSALTATVVVVAAFVLRDRPPAPRPAASVELAPVVAIAPPPVPSAASPAPIASASAAPPSTAGLPAGFGYLTVTSPALADVYISGKRLGPANEALEVRCGRWFVRLAAPREGRYPMWVSRGETVDVGCQAATRIEILPAARP